MNTRLLIFIGAASAIAAPAAAQERVNLTLSWREVLTGTNTPVPTPNGLLEPGESARIAIAVAFAPLVGSTVSYTPPPPPGTGTMAGFGSFFIDLAAGGQFNPSPSGAGLWSLLGRAPGWVLGDPGVLTNAGASVVNMQAGQFVPPGMTANPANPVQDIWHGVWTPASFSPVAVNWRLYPSFSSSGQYLSILIQYGFDPAGNPLYVRKFIGGTFGSTTIPIIPAPSSLALAFFAACTPFITRHRRPTR